MGAPMIDERIAIVVSALLFTVVLAVTGSISGSASEANTAEARPAPLPNSAEEVVAYVTRALTTHDLDAFERLVEWKGARPIRKRMMLAQIRYCIGRPIRSAVVEPFPADGLQQAKSLLGLDPNVPVTERLRVVFDEPPTSFGDLPTSVFLLGKEDGVYRVSLLLASGPPN